MALLSVVDGIESFDRAVALAVDYTISVNPESLNSSDRSLKAVLVQRDHEARRWTHRNRSALWAGIFEACGSIDPIAATRVALAVPA